MIRCEDVKISFSYAKIRASLGYIPNEAVSDNPTPSYASGTDEEDCSSSGIFQ